MLLILVFSGVGTHVGPSSLLFYSVTVNANSKVEILKSKSTIDLVLIDPLSVG
jgi:hypothetical protein